MKNIASSTGLTWLLIALLPVQQVHAQQDFWEPTNGPWGSFVQSLAIDNNTGDFFLAGYGGVYRSVDKGSTWMFAGLPRQYNNAVVIHGNGAIFVGGEEGIFRSTDQGSTWTKVHSAGSIDPHSIVIDRNDHIYFADFFQNVYRSTDNGNTWTDIGLAGVRALAVDSNNRILAATEHGLWRFDGNTWTAEWPANKDLGSVAVNSIGHIFTVQVFGSVFRSTDDGKTWTDIGLTDADVRVLGIGSKDEIFAGCLEGGIFRSNDNGDHWVNTGLSDEQFVNDLTFDTDGRLFASTSSGVYWSADNGNNWTEANTGLRNTYIGALGVDPAGSVFAGESGKGIFQTTDKDGFLFAGTDGSGVFRSKISTTGLKAPAGMTVSKLGQNTPNPCANTTRITYEVARQGPVTISVYDVAGQLVKTLANGLCFPGSYALNVDASGLENGVYFYVMRTGSGEVLARKMVVLR